MSLKLSPPPYIPNELTRIQDLETRRQPEQSLPDGRKGQEPGKASNGKYPEQVASGISLGR